MGETYCNSGQYKLAYEAFHNRIISPRANPALATRYANIMLRMGVEDYLVKRPGSALLKWEQGILFDPTNVELMYALSMGYAKVGDYRQSNVWSAKLIEANEGVGLFRSMYVASLTYRKVITAAAWANMAWSYHQIGDEERAVVCKAYSTDIKSHRPLELDESLQTAKRQE
jgi:tetratricopeptide (TPR) repeat protein